MSIKRRIGQLEKSFGMGSPYCRCPREIVTELILPDLDETDVDRERRSGQPEAPQSCDQCGKEIEVTKIIVEYS